MDLSAPVIAPVGARTHWEVGGPPPAGATEVRAPAGIIEYEPADMTVTAGAGTAFGALASALLAHEQEVRLDPRSDDATIGGILACGLSGVSRLGHGPVRDHVLEVQLVTGYGTRVKGGGPTVKNVTGYDVPRLFVGSMGTLGVLMQATLRCRPRAPHRAWFAGTGTQQCYRPSARLWDGTREMVLLEGTELDVRAQAQGLTELSASPALPDGPHRGRISIAPARVHELGRALTGNVRWCAELGVGTVHVAADDAAALALARKIADAHDGWLLREAGGEAGDDGYGRALPNAPLLRRIKQAFDPDGKLNPGRMPL